MFVASFSFQTLSSRVVLKATRHVFSNDAERVAIIAVVGLNELLFFSFLFLSLLFAKE
jgi:hypothetical protein